MLQVQLVGVRVMVMGRVEVNWRHDVTALVATFPHWVAIGRHYLSAGSNGKRSSLHAQHFTMITLLDINLFIHSSCMELLLKNGRHTGSCTPTITATGFTAARQLIPEHAPFLCSRIPDPASGL